MKEIRTVEMPAADTLEVLVVQLWDTLRHYRSQIHGKAAVSASFDRNGKRYTVTIKEETEAGA